MKNNSTPKVSVIIPVYNAETYLRECIDSVIGQTYVNLEIICVDDGSSDASYSILEQYKESDERIRILKQNEKSRTGALARNMGIKASTGMYLMFLDSDDFFETNAIEEAVKEIERQNCDIVVFNSFIYDTKNKVDRLGNYILKEYAVLHEGGWNQEEINRHILDLSTFAPWNKIYRRDFIVKKKIFFRPVDPDDMEFGFLCIAEAETLAVINRRLIHYRRDIGGTQTNRYIEEIEPIYKPFVFLLQELETRGLKSRFHSEFVRWFLMQFRAYAMQYKQKSLFDEAYNKIKNEKYIEQFGVFDCEDEDLKSDVLVRYRDAMRWDSPEEFLFAITRTNDMVMHELCLCLPVERKKKNKYRIALYGAGLYGKLYERKFQMEAMTEVVCWLDTNYKQFDGLIPPERINDYEFDYVFVAVNEERIYEQIKKFLIDKAVHESCILWMNDYIGD